MIQGGDQLASADAKRPVRIHEEPNPPEALVARVDALEADPLLGGPPPAGGELTEVEAAHILDAAEALFQLWLPGRVHGYAPSLRPVEPTRALPGSKEKVRVMRERVRRGESCFHPGDARLGGNRQKGQADE